MAKYLVEYILLFSLLLCLCALPDGEKISDEKNLLNCFSQ